jgi:HD-GYP domain-containing protein (c-di-GMP phosphodiesterase class II)
VATDEIRLAELMAALSVAIDLSMHDAAEHAQRSAVIAVALAEAAGLTDEQAQDAYYLAMLRTVGCTGDHDFAFSVFGEDLGWMGLAAMGSPLALLGRVARNVGRGSGVRRAGLVARAFASLPQVMRNSQIHCEVGAMLSERLGLGPRVIEGLGQVFERWDGFGAPRRLRGEAIALPVRVALLASDVETATRTLGLEEARDLLRQRAGKGHDPRLVDRFCAEADQIMARLEGNSIWQTVLDAEPGVRTTLSGQRLDLALRSAGEFADMKSSFTRGHSAAVADLTAAACARLGLGGDELRDARRAGHLHDLGRVGVFAYVWDKPGRLSDVEWERVRMHSYYTERVLARLTGLGPVAAMAGAAHERRDGSGYHRRPSAPSISVAARVLAAADVYQALTSPRPHRAALPSDAAAAELRREVSAGRLDPDAVEAVLAAAGHVAAGRRDRSSGNTLTEREIAVLRLLARGLTNKEIAAALDISTRTAGHHVEHIFSKAKVTTRAAAALFAMQNDLLGGAGH